MRNLQAWCERKQPGIVLLPWLAPAVSALSLKYIILCIGGFRESALGLRGTNFLTVAEKFLLFRSDLLLGFVLVPIVLCGLTFFLPPYVRVALSAVLSFLAQIVMTMEAAVYGATKGFATAKTLWAVVAWAVTKHERNIIFMLPSEIAGFVTWVAAAAFCIALALACVRRARPRLNYACLVVFAAGAALTGLGWISRAPQMAWSPALLKMTVHAALVDTDADDANMRARGVDELNQLYRKDSHFPPASPSPFFARAQGENVLFFVLEATSARVFDPASDPLLDMPNARRLRQHAFIAAKHYTTFPGTSQAVFSFFTSLYTKAEVGAEIGDRQVVFPGMIRSLRAAGYLAAYYGYVWKVEKARDDRLLQGLGFDHFGEPDIDDAVDRGGWETFLGPTSYVDNNDRQALRKLRDDIRGWTARGQKFAAAFFPEIAHDPWRELPGRKSASQYERGRALAVHQDAWLGELIAELERDGALDHTIIVVTADHGLRWSPAPEQHIQLASHGTLDDVTLRVPMLIYAPQILARPQYIDRPTSHLDMAPTILDLLGVRSGRELEEGTSILNPAVTQRRLFLWMDPYGATGFFEDGSYYMRTASGTILKSDSLHFEDKNTLPFDGAEARGARQVLAEQGALQNALLFHLLDRRGQP
jgi:arylsulfatase A-like enzyme